MPTYDDIINAQISKMLEMSTEEAARFRELIKEKITTSDGTEIPKYRYIAALDMGCGNTSAYVLPIYSGADARMTLWNYGVIYKDDPSTVQALEKASGIPTILGCNINNNLDIGPETRRYGETAENFKNVPNNANLQLRYSVGDKYMQLSELWVHYFELVFGHVLREAKGYWNDITKENTIFVVAHPSSLNWTIPGYLEQYKALIKGGLQRCDGGDCSPQIITFSEAKAAMQYVRLRGGILNFAWGVLVLDLGASTIDANYRVYGSAPYDNSLNLAGRDVDALLGHFVLEKTCPSSVQGLAPNELPDDTFFANQGDKLFGWSGKTDFTYFIRRFKEDICTPNTSFAGWTYYDGGEMKTLYVGKGDADTPVAAFDGSPVYSLKNILESNPFNATGLDSAIAEHIAQYVNRPNANAGMAVSNVTWYKCFEGFVDYLLDQIESGVNTIVVTGGTANLVGVEECIKRVSKERDVHPSIQIMSASIDYDKAIPAGSASYVMKVIGSIPVLEQFQEDLQKALKQDLLEPVATEYANLTYTPVTNEISKCINAWAARTNEPRGTNPSFTSLNALRKEVKEIEVSQQNFGVMIGLHDAKKRLQILGQQDGVFKNSYAVIQDFLNKLCNGGTYSGSIDTSLIKMELDMDDVTSILRNALQKINVNTLIHGFFPSLHYFFRSDDAPMNVRDRVQIQTYNAKQNLLSEDNYKEEIKNALEAQFDGGVLQATINDTMNKLESAIEQAMFLG